MIWKKVEDVKDFKKIARPICEIDEAKYSLLYGIILDDIFGKHLMLHESDLAIAVQTAPTRPLVISDIIDQQSIQDLANYLETDKDIKEIVGTEETINKILDCLRSSEPGMPKLIMHQRIFRLDKLTKPPIDCHMRQANPKDQAIVSQWFYQFMLDSLVMSNPSKNQIDKMAQTRINNQEVYLLVKDGNVVSMACSNRPTIHGITINGLFTPIEYRGNGLATQMLALLSEKLLQQYDFCCLYSDLNNPASDKIYRQLGYKPVCDSLQYRIKN